MKQNRTSSLKSRKPAESGFTLLELIVVLLLIVLITSFAAPRVSNLMGINLRNGATEMAGYLKGAYEDAVMRHRRVRVRFDLGRNTFWAESYEEPEPTALLNEETKLDKALEAFEKEAEKELNEDEKKDAEEKRYKKLETSALKPKTLPRSIRFKGIFTSTDNKIVDAGTAWIDFSPSGFAPKTIIYLTNDSDNVYTIVLEPLAGRSRIEKGDVRPDDV